ncbi:MAG: 5'/3'-nucleotidase SurE [Phycisphaerales bacterium JB040]
MHAALTASDPASRDAFGGPIGGPETEVFTVAPMTVQSATSHGVTFHQPLMTRPATINGRAGVAVDGRPADCMKLALSTLWPERFGEGERPDLVVSGMNAGANAGINIIYSGTVAAAIEAAFLGVPAVAVSLHLGRGNPDFGAGARHARRAIERVIAADGKGPGEVGLDPHEVININVPRCEAPAPEVPETEEERVSRLVRAGLPSQAPSRGDPTNASGFFPDPLLAGPDADQPHDPEAELPVVVCPMNCHGHADQYERRSTPSGQSYYWAAAGGFDFHEIDAGSDVELLFKRCITVTPLRYDLTHAERAVVWAQRLGEMSAS